MSKVPLSISLLDWFFFSISLSTRSSMERDNIPLELLWEETCESTLAAIGQLATTGQLAHRTVQIESMPWQVAAKTGTSDMCGDLSDQPTNRSMWFSQMSALAIWHKSKRTSSRRMRAQLEPTV